MIILLGPSAHGPLVTSVRWLRLPKFGEFSSVEWVGRNYETCHGANFTVFFSFTEGYIYIYV